MNLKTFKKLAILTFLSTSLLFFITSTKAADQSITCTTSGCSDPGNSLFNQTSVAPGQSFTKSIAITNKFGETLNLNLDLSQNQGTDNDFLPVIDAQVKIVGDIVKFSGTLEDLLTTNIDLGSLNDNGTKTVEINLSLQNVGNDYQGKQANFDLSVQINEQAAGGTDDTNPSPSPALTGLVAGATTFFFAPSPSPEVLGEATPSASQSQSPTLGAKSFNWWWPLAIQFILSAAYLVLKRKSTQSLFWLSLFPLTLALLSQYIHSRLGCPSATQLCPFYLHINSGTFLLSIISLIFKKNSLAS